LYHIKTLFLAISAFLSAIKNHLETFAKSANGCILIGAGTLLMVLKNR